MVIGRGCGGDESDVWSKISKAKIKVMLMLHNCKADLRTQDQRFHYVIYSSKNCCITNTPDGQRTAYKSMDNNNSE